VWIAPRTGGCAVPPDRTHRRPRTPPRTRGAPRGRRGRPRGPMPGGTPARPAPRFPRGLRAILCGRRVRRPGSHHHRRGPGGTRATGSARSPDDRGSVRIEQIACAATAPGAGHLAVAPGSRGGRGVGLEQRGHEFRRLPVAWRSPEGRLVGPDRRAWLPGLRRRSTTRPGTASQPLATRGQATAEILLPRVPAADAVEVREDVDKTDLGGRYSFTQAGWRGSSWSCRARTVPAVQPGQPSQPPPAHAALPTSVPDGEQAWTASPHLWTGRGGSPQQGGPQPSRVRQAMG
jgi:hypothetical protein